MTKQEFIKLYKKYQRYKQSDGDYSKKYKVDRNTLRNIISEIIDKDKNLWSIDLNWLDVSGIEDMSYMFSKSKFNGDISKWNVSNVENMSSMFAESKFNGNISKWDVSNVKDMSFMFWWSEFNSDISEWNVSSIEDMSYMFNGSKYKRLDFLLWDIKPSTLMYNFFPKIRISSYEDFIKLRKKKLTDPKFISTYFDKIIKRLCD